MRTHRASAACAVPARAAYRFLCDGRMLGRWALGCFGARRVGKGLFRGRSLFDGESLLVRPVGDERNLTVHYFIGSSRKALSARIFARIVARSRRRCVVSLTATREKSMSAERWKRLVACHDVEVLLIKSQLER